MGGMRMSSATEEAEYKESANFGMMTKYLRTVNFADWPEDAEDPPLMVARFLDGLFPHNLPSYCNTDVYVVPISHDKADLYAWLPELCVDALRGCEQDVLQAWMASLDPNDCRQFARQLPSCQVRDQSAADFGLNRLTVMRSVI